MVLHHKTISKIRRMITEGQAVKISSLELKIFYDEYADEQEKNLIEKQCPGEVFAKTAEMENAVSFTVVQPEGDPADDVIDDPPDRQYKKDGWFYTYGVYIDLFRAGLLTPEEDKSLNEVLEIAQQFNEDLSFNGKVAIPGPDISHYHLLFPLPKEELPVNLTIPNKHIPIKKMMETPKAPKIIPPPIVVPKSANDTIVPADDDPRFGDERWDTYVLSYMRPHEMSEVTTDKGVKMHCPRNAGLRRVLQELIGPIISVSSDVQCVPDRNNRYLTIARARVTVAVQRKDHPAYGQHVTWEDIGNNYSTEDAGNEIIVAHPATSAQTSAESRCFKKILGLGSVYAAEEMAKTKPRKEFNPDAGDSAPVNRNKPIEPLQVQFIENTCSKYHIQPLDVASQLLGKPIGSLNELDFQSGLTLQKEINSFNYDINALAKYQQSF